MFGDNPILPPDFHNGQTLKVKKIFYTLQGEGFYAGMPSIFIRLYGCNLACTFCDTDFNDYKEMGLDEIMRAMVVAIRTTSCDDSDSSCSSGNQDIITCDSAAIKNNRIDNDLSLSQLPLVVITGGEPFRQPIGALCDMLIERGFKIQIESNGTLYQHIPDAVEVICSPKVVKGKYYAIHGNLHKHIIAIKILFSAHIDDYGCKSVEQAIKLYSYVNDKLYLQPIDEYNEEKNKKNLEKAIELVFLHNLRLSLQLHKILGLE